MKGLLIERVITLTPMFMTHIKRKHVMDYIAIGGLLMAFCTFMGRLLYRRKQEILEAERRISDIESKLLVLETKTESNEADIDELYDLVRELSKIKSDISEIKGMLKSK